MLHLAPLTRFLSHKQARSHFLWTPFLPSFTSSDGTFTLILTGNLDHIFADFTFEFLYRYASCDVPSPPPTSASPQSPINELRSGGRTREARQMVFVKRFEHFPSLVESIHKASGHLVLFAWLMYIFVGIYLFCRLFVCLFYLIYLFLFVLFA